MDIQSLTLQLKDKNKHPPLEQWDPPFCGDMDIHIQFDGTWHYMGTPIGRLPLVKLFAQVLTKKDNDYYLITPVEKVRIKVEDAPFVVTQWRTEDTELGPSIIFTTNVGNEFLLSNDYPLVLPTDTQQAPLYLNIHRNMQAGIHRNVYYQLAEIAQSIEVDGKEQWQIQSAGQAFTIGTQ